MSNELMNIIQNSPQVLQGLDEDTKAVAGNSANSTKRISIKGGVFRKYVGGKEVSAIEDRHMNVIIVKMAHAASRMFYTSNYKEGEKVTPTCWSSDSRTPDKEVKTPQSSSCETCQFSAKNSGPNGTGSGCRLSWRTAVVLPNDPAGDIMQLIIPSRSCFGKEETGKWPFRPYIQMLANNNVSAGRVVTKMQFDTKSESPKLLFSPSAAVDVATLDILQRQAKSQAAEQAVRLTVYQGSNSEEGEDSFTPAQPQAVAPQMQEPVTDVSINEPVIQNPVPAQGQKLNDVSDIVKKWSVKT
jgi:hypothetical protein